MKNKYAWIPSPLAIALLLLALVFTMALVFFRPEDTGFIPHLSTVFDMTFNGMWKQGGMVFLVQMGLMLVLGHILALSAPAKRLLNSLLKQIKSTQHAVVFTCLIAMLAGFVNWGFGLILGAVFAKSVIDHFSEKGQPINAPLIAACGYTGLLIWHGGLSGSSLIKIAEPGHLNSLAPTVFNVNQAIGLGNTVFTATNLLTFVVMMLGISAVAARLNKRSHTAIKASIPSEKINEAPVSSGLDGKKWFAVGFGVLLIFGCIYLIGQSNGGLSFLNPNFLNFSMFGLAFLAHGTLSKFTAALDEAISGSSGILIQFPIYFAIMGIMSESGMAMEMANFFISISNETTLPLFTFISAGVVNLFVPSGGGQWMIQGPIIIESCQSLGIPVTKGIMALAYGDQLTNMLQPFWALPLLGITKVKAHQLLPYTFVFFLVGLVVYGLTLVLF